ncbi:MAG: hypothetical protein AAFX39_08565 [Pseudomonadota bacterium]
MPSASGMLSAANAFQMSAQGDLETSAALALMADAFSASCVTLETVDRRDGLIVALDHARVDPESFGPYREHYYALSPRVNYGLRPDAEPVAHDGLVLAEAEMDRDPFYAEFLTQFGLRYFLSMSIDPHPDIFSVLALQFTPEHGLPDEEK